MYSHCLTLFFTVVLERVGDATICPSDTVVLQCSLTSTNEKRMRFLCDDIETRSSVILCTSGMGLPGLTCASRSFIITPEGCQGDVLSSTVSYTAAMGESITITCVDDTNYMLNTSITLSPEGNHQYSIASFYRK